MLASSSSSLPLPVASLPLPAAALFPPFSLASVLSLSHPLLSMFPPVDPILVLVCLFVVCVVVEWRSKPKSPVHREVGFEALVRSIVVEPVDANEDDPVWDAFARTIVIPGGKAPALETMRTVPTTNMFADDAEAVFESFVKAIPIPEPVDAEHDPRWDAFVRGTEDAGPAEDTIPVDDKAHVPDLADSDTISVAVDNEPVKRVRPDRVRTRTDTPQQTTRASPRARTQSASGYALPEPTAPPAVAPSPTAIPAVEVLVHEAAPVCRPDRVRVRTETPAEPPRVSSRVRTHSSSGLLVFNVPTVPRPAGAAVQRILPLAPLQLPRVAPSPAPSTISFSALAERTHRSPLSLLSTSFPCPRVVPATPAVVPRPSPATITSGAVIYETRPPASRSAQAEPTIGTRPIAHSVPAQSTVVPRPSTTTVIPGAIIYETGPPASRSASAQHAVMARPSSPAPRASSHAEPTRPSPAAAAIPGAIIYQTRASQKPSNLIYSTPGSSILAYPLVQHRPQATRRASKIIYHGGSAPPPRPVVRTRAFLQAQQQASSQHPTRLHHLAQSQHRAHPGLVQGCVLGAW
ncbi:hypothetical protein B0H19DRAFT_293536 [Mycena capillaripes]|nr:hypothetical protein B0H19DRAFT_293536 [Mycena capillaripes]